jgi:acyl-CoA synthetase (AMP-forming)/AMP-acid ligase II
MNGYLAQPEETAAARVDNWFRTGDLARVSPEGFVSAGYKCPRVVTIVDEFPRSATGKILKSALSGLARI